MADRVRFPPGASKRIERLLRERERLERRHLKLTSRDAIALAVAVRSIVERFGTSAWSLEQHARATRAIRAAGRQFGGTLSARARTAAIEAARLGAEQQPRALAIFASSALGQKIAPPSIEVDRALAIATPDVDARTDDVGIRTGEDVAQAVVSASYLETRKGSPLPAVALASGLAAIALSRARERAERVIVTEMTAGAAEGGDAAREQLVKRVPKMRKVWDATLDRRVCSTCAGLHHTVVDAKETWPGGYDDSPAHTRCRCATMPWLDEWTTMLDELGIGPGPRVGVQATAETQLSSFGQLAPAGGKAGEADLQRPAVPAHPLTRRARPALPRAQGTQPPPERLAQRAGVALSMEAQNGSSVGLQVAAGGGGGGGHGGRPPGGGGGRGGGAGGGGGGHGGGGGPNHRDARAPGDRHVFDKITERSHLDRQNTIALPGVDMAKDAADIRAGKGVFVRDHQQGINTYKVNGRVYGMKPSGVLYPISGPGLEPSNRQTYETLGVYRTRGISDQTERHLDSLGVPENARRNARAIIEKAEAARKALAEAEAVAKAAREAADKAAAETAKKPPS